MKKNDYCPQCKGYQDVTEVKTSMIKDNKVIKNYHCAKCGGFIHSSIMEKENEDGLSI